MAKGCGCGGNKTPPAPKWQWTAPDGSRSASNLTEAKAKEKAIVRGGTAEPMPVR